MTLDSVSEAEILCHLDPPAGRLMIPTSHIMKVAWPGLSPWLKGAALTASTFATTVGGVNPNICVMPQSPPAASKTVLYGRVHSLNEIKSNRPASGRVAECDEALHKYQYLIVERPFKTFYYQLPVDM